MLIILGLEIFYLQVASSPKTWGSKPTCPEEQSVRNCSQKSDDLD